MAAWKTQLNADPTDWLLEDSNPHVRYFTLRWLLDEPDDDQDSDVSCESPSEYACHPVYSGPDDTEDLPPAVCGCTPRCESGTFLEVGVGEGNNPDGTRKAVFSCK